MTDQSRQPAGVPSGGQFSGSERPEAGVLFPVPADAGGQSMYFPERQPDVGSHVAWWMRCPIPDELLQDVYDSFPQSREGMLEMAAGGPVADLERDPSWSDAEYNARNIEHIRGIGAKREEWGKVLARSIDRFDVRDVVRLHLARKYSYTLPDAEREKFNEEEFVINGQVGKARRIAINYSMPAYEEAHPDAFERPFGSSPSSSAEIERLRQDLAQQRQETLAVLRQISQNSEDARRFAGSMYSSALIESGYDVEQAQRVLMGEEDVGKQKSRRAVMRSIKASRG